MNQALERILLHHLEGSRAGQVDSFTQPVVVIGRAPDCHLVLDADKGVSGHHCEIRQTGGQFELVDSNSTNGTFVGDERIASQTLNSGDSIRFGWMGPVARVEFDAAVRSVHPDHPMDDSQSTVMVSARHIAAAAAAAVGAQSAAAESRPALKDPQITMPPPSRAPVPSAPPPALAAPPPIAAPKPAAATPAAAAARAPAPPPRPVGPAAPAAPAGGWSTARWIVAIAVVVVVAAGAAFGLWLLIG